MRGATEQAQARQVIPDISIHAPHAGSDSWLSLFTNCAFSFQSTPPMRGATCCLFKSLYHLFYFNPRPPCGERRKYRLILPHQSGFQSTPPMRGATAPPCKKKRLALFQSTPPMRGATLYSFSSTITRIISIHAPHAGSDLLTKISSAGMLYFNPRPPCGERLQGTYTFSQPMRISIHAPHAGSDRLRPCSCTSRRNFNPRPPCGERLLPSLIAIIGFKFQSTPPMRGATA